MNKAWIKDTAIRAVRTFSQTMVGIIGVSTLFSSVNWGEAFSAAGLSAVICILMCISNENGGKK